MGGGKGGSETIYDFLMSIDYGVCHGPLDSLNEIVIKEKAAFSGVVGAQKSLRIDKKDLFGGDDGEGGPVGYADFYLGSYTQTMGEKLAAMLGLTTATAPGYRGLAHVFFRGLVDGKGFKWTSNNPYLPAMKSSVTRTPAGLSVDSRVWPITGVNETTGGYLTAAEGEATFTPTESAAEEDSEWTSGGVIDPETGLYSAFLSETFGDPDAGLSLALDRTKLPDANPAAMIYEIMTNTDWGKGEPEAAMDKESYESCAAVLLSENFGLSMKFMDQDEVQNFVGEILDHIKAVQFQHPRTGLWTLKLIRDDYDQSDLLTLDPSNSSAQNVKTQLWGETINQIVVSYTDPTSEEEETVTAQNLANIAIQGGVASEERDYHGVRNPWLAKILAERDVAEASRVLTSATVYADQLAREVTPGDVVNFTWPDEQIDGMACRVQKIVYGYSKDRRVKLEIVEDVFAAPALAVSVQPQPYLGPVEDPYPENPDRVFVMTPPLPPMIAGGVDPDQVDADYPVTFVSFMVNDSDTPMIDLDVRGPVPKNNGGTSNGSVAKFTPTPVSPLGVVLVSEASSRLPGDLVLTVIGEDAEAGDLMVIGDSEDRHEIVILDGFDADTYEWVVIRAGYDTLPEEWAATDLIWEMPTGSENGDPYERVAGSAVTYRFLPRTQKGTLDVSEAPDAVFTPSERPHLPFRPASPEIDGNGAEPLVYPFGDEPDDLTFTWATRNRLGEDAVAVRWDEASAAPEAGQTTLLRFRDVESGEIEIEVSDLSGSSHTMQTGLLANAQQYDVEFVAVRDGLESLRAAVRRLELERRGYGFGYGVYYGP